MHANRCAVNVYGIRDRGAPGGASVCLPAAARRAATTRSPRSPGSAPKKHFARKSADKTRERKTRCHGRDAHATERIEL